MTFTITTDELAFIQRRKAEADTALAELKILQDRYRQADTTVGEFLALLAKSRGADPQATFAGYSIEQKGADINLTLNEKPV